MTSDYFCSMRYGMILIGCAVGHLMNAQPVIGVGDLPQGGVLYTRTNAAPPPNAGEVETSGANVTWDFSNLIGTEAQDTEYFPMSSASFTAQLFLSSADHFTSFAFPEFPMELPIPIDGANLYYEYGDEAYQAIAIGLGSGLDLPLLMEDAEERLPLPCEYGASLDATSAFTVDLGLLFYATEQTTDIEVDAWGTLLLPGGEFDCLRVKRTFSALDTIYVAAADIGFTVPREGTVYEWYAPGEGMPVLSVQTFIDIPAIWQYKPGETDAVTESAPVDWKLGPSPLQLGAPLHCPGLAGRDLLVTDAMGRTLFRGQPTVTGTLATLDTKGWTSGMVVVTDLGSGRSARVVIR